MWRLPCSKQVNRPWLASCPSFYCRIARRYHLLSHWPYPGIPPDSRRPWRHSKKGHSHAFWIIWVPPDALRSLQCCTDISTLVLQSLDFVYVYIDDLLIASSSPEEHLWRSMVSLSTSPKATLEFQNETSIRLVRMDWQYHHSIWQCQKCPRQHPPRLPMQCPMHPPVS